MALTYYFYYYHICPPRDVIFPSLTCYLAAILLVPELIIGRFLQTLAATLVSSLDEVNKKSISVEEFFNRVDTVRFAFDKTSHVSQISFELNAFSTLTHYTILRRHMYIFFFQIFRNIVLAITMIMQTHIVLESYVVVSRFISYGLSINSVANVTSLLYIFLAFKRLVHLTSLIYSFQGRVSDAQDKLYDLEVSPSLFREKWQKNNVSLHLPQTIPEHQPQATRLVQLLSKVNGMSLHGFFLLDRTMFPSLAGFFLTYFFLLLQFKLAEKQ